MKQHTIIKKTAFWSLGLAVIVVSLSLSAIPATAHEGMEHVNGTITSLGDNLLSVKDTKGKTVEIHVDAKTEYAQGKTAAKFSDLKVGDRVAVHAMEMKGVMVAHEVNLPAKPAAKVAKKATK
jgi:hypothetical protein